MKSTLVIFALFIAGLAAAPAQVVPAAIGPSDAPASANFHYDLRYAQTAEFTNYQGNWQSGIISADLNYANGSPRHPFSVNLDGGYDAAITGPDYQTGYFQHLYVSQGFVARKWNIVFGDNESYMPQSPVDGFSGIAGSGEPIGGAPTPPASSQSILSFNTHTINNSANVDFEDRLNYDTVFNAGGSSALLRFPDTNGIDTDQQMVNASITRNFTSRNALTGQYAYSHYSYPDLNFATNVSSAEGVFSRKWTRLLSTSVSAGPQWLSSSDSGTVPSSLRVAVNASANYKFRSGTANVEYIRGISGGSGYLIGAEVDTVTAGYSRDIQRTLTIGFNGSYQRTAGLTNGVIDAKIGAGQITKRLSRYLLVFANYTAIDQSSSLPVTTNILTNLQQVLGFGIAYSPRETHIKQ